MELTYGFFIGRTSPELEPAEYDGKNYERYANVTSLIGTLVSSKMVKLHELDFYSLEDAYDLLEIVLVDNHNSRVANTNG